MQIFQIDDNLYQSSMIDDVFEVKMFDVCLDLSGGIDLGANDFKIYLKWSIEDKGLPDLGVLEGIASFGYHMAYREKMKVLVHCNEGINRSSLINGVILHLKGMKGQEIIDFIRSKRPGALTNPNFVNYLKNLN